MSAADSGRAAACAVVVTYHPDEDVAENLRALVRECGLALVIDNGSSAAARAALAAVAGAEVIALGANLGIATALNRGVAEASARGYSHAVLFDQDSRPEPGFCAALLATAAAHPRAAVVAPRIAEQGGEAVRYRWARRHPVWRFYFQRVGCAGADLPDVMMAVTSGSLVEIAAWRELGGSDESLFIDYVDTDYCLRISAAGRAVAVSAGALLRHRLGDRRVRKALGVTARPTNHAAFRHYYMARNRVRLWRRHALARPDWAAFDFTYLVYNTIRVLAFETARRRKLKAMSLGTWDGLRGRGGPCPAERRRVFDA